MTLEEFKQVDAYKDIVGKDMAFKGSYKYTLEYTLGDYCIFYTGNHYRNEFEPSHKFEEFEWGIDNIEIGREPTSIIVYLS